MNLENLGDDGWYDLEQAWAKDTPGFVSEPPEGTEVNNAIEAGNSEITDTPSQEVKPAQQSETKSFDPALEKIAVSLESGHGSGTRLERWAKHYRVIVYTLADDTRKIDRRKFFALVENMDELNSALKGPIKPEYAWFPQTFHRICYENGHAVPLPECADGFEVNLLLDHLRFQGAYSCGTHQLQDQGSITRKLEFLVQNWAEVVAGVQKYGFILDRPDIPSFDWVISNGENVFNCVHQKMEAGEAFQLDELLKGVGVRLN